MAFPPLVPAWKLYAGDDAELTLTFTNTGETADLTGFTSWQASWRRALPGTDQVDPSAVNAEPLVVDSSLAGQGVVTIQASSEQTRVDGVIRDEVWDLQATRDGKTVTLARGLTVWKADVTR